MTAHSEHKVRRNSIAAHSEERKRRSRRADQIVSVYARARRPLRDREVMQALGFVDMNAVRPCITVLIDRKVLREVGDSVCPVTQKTVRLAAISSYDDPQGKIDFKQSTKEQFKKCK